MLISIAQALPHAAFSDSLVSGRRLLDRRELVGLHGAFGKAGGDSQFFAQVFHEMLQRARDGNARTGPQLHGPETCLPGRAVLCFQ